jgi:hypothetical protein
VFDHQAEQNLAAENEHVAAVKEELRPAVERARAKRAGLKAAWAKRNDFVSEVNSHQYVNGVPESAMRYIRDLNMSDPVAALDRVISEYENISCSQINDGTGLNRWPVDPNRRSAMIGAILTGLRTADLTD